MSRPSGLNAGRPASPGTKSSGDRVTSGFAAPARPLVMSKIRMPREEKTIRRRPSRVRVLDFSSPSSRPPRSTTERSGWTAAAVSAARASGTSAIRQEARPSSIAVSGSVAGRFAAAPTTARAEASVLR
ncbi:hypothetical protein, partial [Streptomyces sp. wa1063]|uniref:hypothetical protein n=1 Tax=Streptomyces sp. wa1063 TaxID=1828212 RepID=UPI00117F1B9F